MGDASGRVQIEYGDCLEVMPRLLAEGLQVEAIVTDPPYHLTSIVKRFGAENAAPAQFGQDGAFARMSKGFMGKTWDGGNVAFRPATWALALELLQPGGHLLAFGGTRTFHRLTCAIEDAGFEIRDCVLWLYGSGFPKSRDVSKAIDAEAGAVRAPTRQGMVKRDGYGDDWDTGSSQTRPRYDEPATNAAREWQGWGTALKPAWEPIIIARKPLAGTVAQNVQQHGTGALNIDGCRVAADDALEGRLRHGGGQYTPVSDSHPGCRIFGRLRPEVTPANPAGRWPANVIHDGSAEVLAAFGGAAAGGGYGKRGGSPDGKGIYNADFPRGDMREVGFGDTGTAARFFYTAKADAEDRLGSNHPTVKPVDLIAYLCRLVTPPGGTVLDPFAGSGTTAMACLREGFDCIAIEREAEHVADIERRLAHVGGADTPLFTGIPEDGGTLFDV